MKILVTGANGQLGRELLLRCRAHPVEPAATDVDELDITDAGQVETHFDRLKPDLLINTAAYTQVDRAESEQQSVFRINRDGPRNLAQACSKFHVPMIHISSDYVFDGKKGRPYVESDPLSPLGIYARSKAEAENHVRTILVEHIILRTSWLYGVFGHNFVKTMLRLGKEKKTLQIVSDQFGSPTSAADLAHTVLQLADRIRKEISVRWGTYHYCGKGVSSWFQFAEKIFELSRQHNRLASPRLEPITTAQYVTVAKRPPYSHWTAR